MLIPFFTLAAQSPGRQNSLRWAVLVHVSILAGTAWAVGAEGRREDLSLLGHVALLAGIVEGAALVGWRLTQLPRSQALEFLLVSPINPRRVFLGEALVGLARLALVTFAGLPVLALLMGHSLLDPETAAWLLVLPWTCGALTGLGLTAWAYEPQSVRRIGERVALVMVVAYLVLGVLGAGKLYEWGSELPRWFASSLRDVVRAFLDDNPFAILRSLLLRGSEAAPLARMIEGGALTVVGLLVARACCRLLHHYRERHYQPAVRRSGVENRRVGEAPLAWWAVRRVSHFSGRVNLWLAGGFGLLYALYTVAGTWWPEWLGRTVFELCDQWGGIPVLATGLVLLGAVPAAFQYGLWDSNTQDRCRRLELLLLTRLDARDYWQAAAAAAWNRGRGYLAVAVLLWIAALFGGKMSLIQVCAALSAAVLLWSLYFALGFRAFSKGMHSNGLGLFLTVGVPLLGIGSWKASTTLLSVLIPATSLHMGSVSPNSELMFWAAGPVTMALLTLFVARRAIRHCDSELRHWYELHHGRKVMS
jgi:hypothetical protein